MKQVKPFSSLKRPPRSSSPNESDLICKCDGIGIFTPGILRLGYAGGGPYLCMLRIQGGGQLSAIPRA
jgi:hypothetical protein